MEGQYSCPHSRRVTFIIRYSVQFHLMLLFWCRTLIWRPEQQLSPLEGLTLKGHELNMGNDFLCSMVHSPVEAIQSFVISLWCVNETRCQLRHNNSKLCSIWLSRVWYAIVMSTAKSTFFLGVNVRRFRELPSPTHKLVTHVKIDVKNDEQN